MPVHLPPLSRRAFLAGTIATGAGLVLPQRLWAGPETDPNRWILLSDTHVCGDAERVHSGVQPVGNFRKARAEFLAADGRRPAGVITCGDCAFLEGLAEDYARLAEEVCPIRTAGLPVHFVMGNHDRRETLYAAMPEAMPQAGATLADRHVSVIETPTADWVLLDTLIETNHTPGQLDQAQREWLAQTLDAGGDKPALVMFHHNPDRREKPSGLIDTQEMFDTVLPRKRVKAVLYGHTHCWKNETIEGVHFVNLPTLVWVFDKTQPRGWVDAGLRAGGMTLKFHGLEREHPAHGQTVELAWRS